MSRHNYALIRAGLAQEICDWGVQRDHRVAVLRTEYIAAGRRELNRLRSVPNRPTMQCRKSRTYKTPADWELVNTHFGGLGLNGTSARSELRAAEFIQQRAITSDARVIIFPETSVPRWTAATDLFWQPNLNAIASSGKTIVIGTTLNGEGRPGYENGVIVRGAQTGTFLQHIPVPVGMWNPIRPSSVPLHIFGPSIITIEGRRAAILVCYEQFLTWPVLKAVLERPNLFVGIANDYWFVNTRVPAMQRRVMRMWANLFQIPALTATNL